MDISPVDRVYAKVTVAAKLADGSTATVSGVDVTLLPYRTDPTSATTWTATSYSGGVATVLLAGPAADPTGALAVPAGGGVLWVRINDNPETQAVRVGFVSVS